MTADASIRPSESASADAKPQAAEKPGLWRGFLRPLLVLLLIITALRSSLLDWNDVPTGSMEPTILVGDRIVVNKLAYGLNLPFNGPAIAIPFTGQQVWNPLDFLPGFYYSEPDRGDIVTFWNPESEIRMVKRIVGVPGDTVSMRPADEPLRVNGKAQLYSILTIDGEDAKYTVTGSGITESILGETRRVQYLRGQPVIDPETGRQARYRDTGELAFHRPEHWAVSLGPVTLGEDEYLMIGDNRDNSRDGRFFGPVHLKQITGEALFIGVSFGDHFLDPNWDRWLKGLDP